MKIFCSGIGGIGMSAYAAYQHHSGHDVSGSDCIASVLLDALQGQGIPIALQQDVTAVPEDTDLFVYTLALPEGHPEWRRAQELGIKQQTYFEALGDLARMSEKTLIAVCGTHGKSSTTAMAAKMLIEAGSDPSVILGTKTADLGGRNWRKGDGKYFLAEACEYRRSFLHLSPSIILLTNVDGDHFDAFSDLQDYQRAFQEFLARLPSDGILITHSCDEDVESIVQYAKARKLRVVDADTFLSPTLTVPGEHMRENARLVLALAEVLGIGEKRAEHSLRNYAGSWRRMEIRGETSGGVLVIDDYGHHPREVAATLQALREKYAKRRILCVFQPHTHDRTIKLYREFTKAFTDADIVIIPNIYDARPEISETSVHVATFVADIAHGSNVEAYDGQSFEQTVSLLQEHLLQPGDVFVTMGAGDVWRIAQQLTTDH